MPVVLGGSDSSVSANSVILAGTTSGTIRIQAPDAAGSSILTVPASNGRIAVNKQTEIDFGSTGLVANTYIITDSAVVSNSVITGSVAYEAPTGKDLDEVEMDYLNLRFGPGVGQFTLFISTTDGSLVADKFKINYSVG